MTSTHPHVISIGECMVELSRGNDGRFGLGYGGDTFNTAVYLARCGVPVAYATALGDDPYSRGIVALAREEGVGTDLVLTRAGRTAGLYLIETSAGGERTFHYWRDRAPARELLDQDDAAAVLAAIRAADMVYLSGITLSLYQPEALDRLAGALADARRAGGRVVMDGNFRPRGWGGDCARARTTFERFWRLADIALPTLDDEMLLWGDRGPAATLARLRAFGIAETVVKRGADGALVAAPSGIVEVPILAPVTAVDTCAAGDSFNAAYLAARLRGAAPAMAAADGNRLAGIVVQHRGAIVPRTATDAFTRRPA